MSSGGVRDTTRRSIPTRRSSDLPAEYKEFSDALGNRSSTLFDAIVSRALLPVFTLILGYIFGSRTETRARDRKSTRLNSSDLVISSAVFCFNNKHEQKFD